MSCRNVQLRLEVEHLKPSTADLEHLSRCVECAAHRALLRDLQADLLTRPPVPPSLAVLARVEEQAREALWAAPGPPIFRRDMWLPLALALFALPLAVVQGWLWLRGLHFLLEAWLPISFLTGISILYIGSLGVTLGLLYAVIPFAVAYSRQIQPEAP